jgi:UrcA family protein
MAKQEGFMEQFANTIRGAIVGIAALASLAPTGASAAPPIEQLPTAIVSYADLDLAVPKDAAKLRARVTRAAQSVCQFDYAVRNVARMAAQRGCVRRALASADIKIAAAQRSNGPRTALALNMWFLNR